MGNSNFKRLQEIKKSNDMLNKLIRETQMFINSDKTSYDYITHLNLDKYPTVGYRYLTAKKQPEPSMLMKNVTTKNIIECSLDIFSNLFSRELNHHVNSSMYHTVTIQKLEEINTHTSKIDLEYLSNQCALLNEWLEKYFIQFQEKLRKSNFNRNINMFNEMQHQSFSIVKENIKKNEHEHELEFLKEKVPLLKLPLVKSSDHGLFSKKHFNEDSSQNDSKLKLNQKDSDQKTVASLLNCLTVKETANHNFSVVKKEEINHAGTNISRNISAKEVKEILLHETNNMTKPNNKIRSRMGSTATRNTQFANNLNNPNVIIVQDIKPVAPEGEQQYSNFAETVLYKISPLIVKPKKDSVNVFEIESKCDKKKRKYTPHVSICKKYPILKREKEEEEIIRSKAKYKRIHRLKKIHIDIRALSSDTDNRSSESSLTSTFEEKEKEKYPITTPHLKANEEQSKEKRMNNLLKYIPRKYSTGNENIHIHVNKTINDINSEINSPPGDSSPLFHVPPRRGFHNRSMMIPKNPKSSSPLLKPSFSMHKVANITGNVNSNQNLNINHLQYAALYKQFIEALDIKELNLDVAPLQTEGKVITSYSEALTKFRERNKFLFEVTEKEKELNEKVKAFDYTGSILAVFPSKDK